MTREDSGEACLFRARQTLPGLRGHRATGWRAAGPGLWALLLLISLAASADAQNPPVPRILFLFANDHRIPATITLSEAARSRLDERLGDVIIHSDFLDLQRFPTEADQQRVARFLTEKYAGTRIDAVIAFGPQSLAFIADHWQQGVPSLRILYCAVGSDMASSIQSRMNVAGTANEFDYGRLLEMARNLQPQAKKVVVIIGSSNFDHLQEQRIRQQLAPYAGQIEIEYWSGLWLSEVLDRVTRLPPDTILFPGSFRAEPSGEVVVPSDVGRQVVRTATAPTYSVYDTQIGHGLVASYGAAFEDDGAAVGDLTADLLQGKDIGPPPVRRELPKTYRVDARQLERWGFSRSALPAEAIMLFEPPSIWDEHRLLVLAAAGVMLAQSAMLAALLWQRRQRQRAEEETALQRQEVAHLTRVAVLGELSGAIAHEINQPLSAILSNAHAALDILASGPRGDAELRAIIEDIVRDDNRAAEVIVRLRKLLKKERTVSEEVDVNAIVLATVHLLTREMSARKITLGLQLGENLPAIEGDAVQVQQVVLNLLMNAMDAVLAVGPERRIVTVSTAWRDDMLRVEVRDGGPGLAAIDRAFEPFYTTKQHGLGLGLAVCRTIVEAHGGLLELENDVSQGGAVARAAFPAAAPKQTEP